MSSVEALEQALNIPQGETAHRLHESGLAIADIDTMAQAIHDVYCVTQADHSHPSDKDREQAQSLVEALQKRAAGTEA